MSTMTIRDIDDSIKAQLQMRATRHGRSMEDEAREILLQALSTEPEPGASLYEAIRAIVEPLGGVELQLPRRGPGREPPDFSNLEACRSE